jgi:hypothetical protein
MRRGEVFQHYRSCSDLTGFERRLTLGWLRHHGLSLLLSQSLLVLQEGAGKFYGLDMPGTVPGDCRRR